MKITLVHLYPQNLNLYGDTGNILCLKRRCEWRGIDVEIINSDIGNQLEEGVADIYFMGGGQDSDQIKVVDDFFELKQKALMTDITNNAVFLGVCGGYQLMGKEFLMGDGNLTRGLNIIDITTKAPGTEVKSRCIGNLVAKINSEDYKQIKLMYSEPEYSLGLTRDIPQTIIGFENHSGQTYISSEKVKPFGETIIGFGNNASEGQEGARFLNVFGCYMHGPFLPKNPHIADYLIWLALKRKYGEDIKLNKLNDEIEYSAHGLLVNRFTKSK